MAETFTIMERKVNDAPVNTVPGVQTLAEDTVLVFSSGNGNAIRVADVDAGNNPVQVTLTATPGVLTLGGTVGMSFTTGDGLADPTLTFSGTLVDVNAALEGLAFQPAANFNGPASLTVTTNDQGNTGAGGPQSDTDAVPITVAAVNDAPVAVNDAYSIDENQTLAVPGAQGVVANDTDVDGDTLTAKVVRGPAHGTLRFNANGSFSYTPDLNFFGADAFT